jgi:hypothetical protein
LAVQQKGSVLSGGADATIAFWAADEQCATLYSSPKKTVGRKALAVLDFGQRRFKLTMPDDRGLAGPLAEWWDRRHRRRAWRAGSALVSEIRNDWSPGALDVLGTFEHGSFERDGTLYQVRRGGSLTEQTGRVSTNNREIATIENSTVSRKQMLITPAEPVRLDLMLIAFHMFFWLPVRGTGPP